MAGKLMQTYNINTVPLLDENDFDVWKDRMTKYMDSIDDRLMMVVRDGPIFPLKVNTSTRYVPPLADVDGAEPSVVVDETLVKKPRNEWTEEDKITNGLDAKAAYILACGLTNKLYKHIYNCKTAQQVWTALLQYFEGNQITKDNKLYDAIQEFEAFKKGPSESLRDAYDRFCDVSNTCSGLGKEYSMKDLNMRFLSSLGSSWHIKITAIKESRDLNKTHIRDLVSSLFLYERELLKLQTVDKNLKQLALPAQSVESLPMQNLQIHAQPEASSSAEPEDEFAAFARNYIRNKFIKSRQPNSYQPTYQPQSSQTKYLTSSSSQSYQKPYSKPSDGKNAQGELVCFNCRKPGHFASKCPKPKFEVMRKKAPRFYPKQKGLVAEETVAEALVWIESDSEDDQVDRADFAVADFAEEADVSFMALDAEPNTPVYKKSNHQHVNHFQGAFSESEAEEDSDDEEPLPKADNPHGYILHRYSGGLYGQSGKFRARSRIVSTSEPVTPIKPPNKSPTFTPTKNPARAVTNNFLLTDLSAEVPSSSRSTSHPLLKADVPQSKKQPAAHPSSPGLPKFKNEDTEESLTEYSKDEMADIMNQMFNDFEELKVVHNVLSDDFKRVSTENFGLKAELMLLSGFQDEFEALKSENLSLAEKVKVCVAQIGDLVSRNKNLENIVYTFSKPQAAVKAINATQSVQLNKTGVGYTASRKSHAAETSCKDSEVNGNEYSQEELLNDSRDKAFNAVPLVYPSPKNQTKVSGKNKLPSKAAEKRVADTKARNSNGKAPLTDSSSSSDYPFDICGDDTSQSDVRKSVKNKNRRSKLKKVQFVPAENPSPSAQLPKDEENSVGHQKGFSKCQLCDDFGHLAHDCLLRFISASKGSKPPAGNQMWVPKHH